MGGFRMKCAAYAASTPRCAVLIAVLSLAIYVNSLGNDFVWSDKLFVADRQGIVETRAELARVLTRGLYGVKAGRAETPFQEIYYRPMMILSFTLDHLVWGLRPAGYHLTNVLWHTLNGILVFLLLDALLARRRVALLASLLFVAHPIHTASVSCITNRLDILSMFFLLAAWGACARAGGGRSGERARGVWLAAGGLAFALALFSKETAIVLPALLILHAWCFWSGTPGARARRLLPCLVMLAVVGGLYLGLRRMALGTFGGREHAVQAEPLSLLFTMLNVFRDYVRVLVWPSRFTTSGAFPVSRSLGEGGTLLSLALLLGLAGAGGVALGRWRPAAFAVFWFLVTLLPVSNVVPIIYLRADHFLYIPSFGFALLTALLLDRLWGASPRGWARAAGPAAAAGLLAAYACVTVVRNRDWKDDLTLFGRSVQVTPYCREAHAYLGFACQEAGRYEEAVREYRLALAEDPAYCTFMRPGRVLRSLGEVRLEQGRWEEARRHYVESLQREPGSAQAYVGLGRASFGEGRYAEAVAAFQRALQLDPTEAAAHHNLGSAYLELGECEQAVAAYRAELALAPAKPSAHYCLGLAYEKWGRHADAAASFRQALALLPGNEEVGAALARVAAAEGAATGWPAADTKD